MQYLWLVLAVICLGYYIRCATYAGIGSSFISVWIGGALFFSAVFLVKMLEITHIISIPIWLKTGFMILFSACAMLFWGIEVMIIAKMRSYPKENCNYIIVLGCQIRGERITKSLRKRLETATAYAKEHDDVKIIVSGGQGADEFLSEAQAMYNYLTDQGIHGERIFMEDKSTNTEQNLRFSLPYIEDKSVGIGIVTSNFHIFRAVRIAKAKGLHNACGIASPSDSVLIYNYMVREAVGVIKDFIVGNFTIAAFHNEL